MAQASEEVDERSSLLPSSEETSSHLPSRCPSSSSSSPSQPENVYDSDHVSQDSEAVDPTVIWTVIPVVVLGVFVAHADTTLVIASIQKVSSEFDALSSASWLFASYALAQCAVQPLYGKLSIIFGRKNNLAFCYMCFAVGCLICAIGQQYWQIIAGRVISGIGGAGMTALISVIIADLVPLRKIAAWRSFVNVAATTGRALGGPVGGLLTDTIGWRWAFLGQVPLTIIGLLLVLWRLPNDSKKTQASGQGASILQKCRRIDFLGAFALASTISCLLVTLDGASKGYHWYTILILAVVMLILATIFCWVELRYAVEPVVPMELLTRRVAWTSYLLIGFQIAAQTAILYSAPIYFQIASHTSVSEAGLRLSSAVVGNALGGILSGVIISKTNRYKALTVAASIIATTGYTLILVRWRGPTSWIESQYIFFGGFGMGIMQSTSFIHLAANMNQDDIAIAGTMLYTSQNIFGVTGAQLWTAVLYATLPRTLDHSLTGIPNKQEVIKHALESVDLIRSLPETIRQSVEHAYMSSMHNAFGVPVVFGSLGLLLGVTVQEGRM